jgi:glycosyltransferase involved in cell wall biosynthesis
MTKRSVVVEGWRFLPHSYAIVSQNLCREFLKDPGIALFHRNLPPFRAEWQEQRGLLPAEAEARIASIPEPPADLVPDVVFRCAFPYDLTPARAGVTLVQMTAELGMMPDQCMTGNRRFADAYAASNCTIVTPSAYCRDGLVTAGAAASRVAIVPHGVDTEVFGPLPADERAHRRRALGWDGRFVFLNIGTMTDNKGLHQLLSAFASIAPAAPSALLCLKGLDGLYKSSALLGSALRRLQLERSPIVTQLRYDGAAQATTDLAGLYATADAYVSPYLAEGFNMPVLEAAACGLPVICTAGGPTDEFITADFACRIPARRGPSPWGVGQSLAPDAAETASLMLGAMQDAQWRRRAGEAGPAHVRRHYTWAQAARQMTALFSAARPA